jgi:hypothetical protein
MSGNGYWNLGQGPDKFGPRLSRWRGVEARTCLGWGVDMSSKGFWNPVKTTDMSGSTGTFGLWV